LDELKTTSLLIWVLQHNLPMVFSASSKCLSPFFLVYLKELYHSTIFRF